MKRITAHAVIQAVCQYYGLTRAEIASKSRIRKYVRPRQIAVYLIRDLCPHMSFPRTSEMLGGQDHTTAIHAYQSVTRLLARDPDIAIEVRQIQRFIMEVHQDVAA